MKDVRAIPVHYNNLRLCDLLVRLETRQIRQSSPGKNTLGPTPKSPHISSHFKPLSLLPCRVQSWKLMTSKRVGAFCLLTIVFVACPTGLLKARKGKRDGSWPCGSTTLNVMQQQISNVYLPCNRQKVRECLASTTGISGTQLHVHLIPNNYKCAIPRIFIGPLTTHQRW